MINPAQFQRVLGQASDEQLMTMLRRPDKIPSQFIVAEINRRQAMRQASKAQQAGLAQQMAQQPPSQMQQMPRQEPRMEPRGMREGGMVANAQQLSEISNQLSNLVAGGGPNIWVNLQTNTVQGYWWSDYYEHHFTDNIGVDDYLAELHSC